MEELVIDASVSGSWVIESEATPEAGLLLEKVVNHQLDVIVPSLWIYEMINILKSSVGRKRLTSEDASQGLRIIQEIPVRVFHPDQSVQRAMFGLSVKHNISVYDASYITIAGQMSCRFVTADKKLLSLRGRLPFITPLEALY